MAAGWSSPISTPRPIARRRKKLPAGVEVRWADLTDSAEVERLLADVAPAAIIHLAAVIPPPIYRNAKLARKVNVGATAALVRAAEAQPTPPRFVQASSNAVYGSRNPHRHDGPVDRRHSTARGRSLQRNQTRGRRTGACFEPSVGGAAAGRGAERRPEGDAVQRRRVVLRELCCPPTAACTASTSAMSQRHSLTPRRRTSWAKFC